MNGIWDRARVADAIAKLEAAGYPQPKIAEMAGVTQPTVSRWANEKVRPGSDAVRRLMLKIWRDHPDVARELTLAAGHTWAEPREEELPPLELKDDPETLGALERAYNDDPDRVREVARELLKAEGKPVPPSGLPGAAESA